MITSKLVYRWFLTNIVDGMTNIVDGTTNIVDGATNIVDGTRNTKKPPWTKIEMVGCDGIESSSSVIIFIFHLHIVFSSFWYIYLSTYILEEYFRFLQISG